MESARLERSFACGGLKSGFSTLEAATARGQKIWKINNEIT
jgi:hypothetical protein